MKDPINTKDALIKAVAEEEIDTVILAITDMQGRLQGKFIHAQFFVDECLTHGAEGCNYLMAVDVDMNTVDGYEMSSWESGYGDFAMQPDLNTMRIMPWREKTVIVLADVLKLDHSPVTASPRQILRKQLERLNALGMQALVGTELEFIVFEDSFEEAWNKGYKNLVPGNQYNVDYSILGSSRVEPLVREIRNAMYEAGMVVESAKGECNLGQHEIAFKYRDALGTCDNHVIYKMGAKDIAAQQGKSLTFMAKFNEREGNSCHIHLSFRGLDDSYVMAGEEDEGMSDLGKAFIAGQIAHMKELTLLYAPNINSYKRYVPGSFAPTSIRWGRDNRTCAFRLVGHGPSLRLENRVPGGDVNPYLAVAGMIAAGIDGIEKKLKLEPVFTGNAYESDSPRVPSNMTQALTLWSESKWITETFGKDVQDHYTNMAQVELAAFGKAITDWERVRNFERF